MKTVGRRQGVVLGLAMMLMCIDAGAQSGADGRAAGEPPAAAATGPSAASEQDTPSFPEDEDNDPFEGFNRGVYKFNDYLDRGLIKPVARGYDKIMPGFIKTGVRHFFHNLFEPTVIVNDALQGKFMQFLSDTGRFLVNTTVGVVGLFDVAKHINLPPHNEDFGQTLGVWGIGEGPYLVLPFFGPRNIRDSFGLLGDWVTDPLAYVENDKARLGTRIVRVIDTRAQLLKASQVLEQATDDQYLFIREAYRQQRRSLIHDGAVPPQ